MSIEIKRTRVSEEQQKHLVSGYWINSVQNLFAHVVDTIATDFPWINIKIIEIKQAKLDKSVY